MESQKRKNGDGSNNDAEPQESTKKARVEQPEPPSSAYQIYEDTVKALRSSVKELNHATSKHGSTTDTDDYARAAISFLPRVREISSMQGHLGLAWDLLMKIAENAFSPALSYHNPGRGGSAVPYMELDVDMLLLIKLRRERDNDIYWMSQVLTKLENRRDHLLKFGLQGWFSRCIDHMRSALGRATVVEEESQMQEDYQETAPLLASSENPGSIPLVSLYRQTVQELEKDIAMFDGANERGRKCSFRTGDYAANAVRFIPKVFDLSYMEGFKGLFIAFILLLRVSDAAYGNLGDYNEDCRDSDSEKSYRELDEALLWLIERRVMAKVASRPLTLVERQTEWLRMSNSSINHRKQWERTHEDDWVVSTLEDLTQTSYRLASYGLDGWFPKSIRELQHVVEQRKQPPLDIEGAHRLYDKTMTDIRWETIMLRELRTYGLRPADCVRVIVKYMSVLRQLVGYHTARQPALYLAKALINLCVAVNKPDRNDEDEQSTGATFAELDDIFWVLIERNAREKRNLAPPYNQWIALTHKTLTGMRDHLDDYGVDDLFRNSIISLEIYICGDLAAARSDSVIDLG